MNIAIIDDDKVFTQKLQPMIQSLFTKAHIDIYHDIDDSAGQLKNEISNVQFKRIFEEAVESCKKANASLCSAFDIDIESYNNIIGEQESTKWWEYLIYIPTCIVIAIPALIYQSIKANSAKHIAEEAHYTVGKTLRMYNEQLRDVVSTDVLQSRVT